VATQNEGIFCTATRVATAVFADDAIQQGNRNNADVRGPGHGGTGRTGGTA
jgi:hypothetical protein